MHMKIVRVLGTQMVRMQSAADFRHERSLTSMPSVFTCSTVQRDVFFVPRIYLARLMMLLKLQHQI